MVIDLRSDTMTKPSRAMRDAMANAEVGDEQEREDPTVLELERRAAALLGQEESVYLPTATMGNQIALAILGERGSELIVEERAHIMVSELGGAAMHSGLQTRGLPGYRGRLTPAQLQATVNPRDDHDYWTPRTSILARREHPQHRGRHRMAARRAPRARRGGARPRPAGTPGRRTPHERSRRDSAFPRPRSPASSTPSPSASRKGSAARSAR